jgi:hypothetical protein
MDGMREMTKRVEKLNSCEPIFYMAFVLNGTEQQYVDLLRYVKEQNGAQLIYQCKSLTYLYVSREQPGKGRMAFSQMHAETVAEEECRR